MSSNGTFVVASVDTAGKNYVVQLQSDSNPDVPSCECVDWRRHLLPCKHLLAVVNSQLCGGWTSLPEVYRSLPVFTADPDITASPPTAASTATPAETPSFENAHVETIAAHETATSNPTMRLQSKLRQLLSSMIDSTYSVNDVDFLKNILDTTNAQLQILRQHSDPAVPRAAFRRSRRLVRGSIAASSLRRRMSVIRARRRKKKLQRQAQRQVSDMHTIAR